jgi:hypothetical protein
MQLEGTSGYWSPATYPLVYFQVKSNVMLMFQLKKNQPTTAGLNKVSSLCCRLNSRKPKLRVPKATAGTNPLDPLNIHIVTGNTDFFIKFYNFLT